MSALCSCFLVAKGHETPWGYFSKILYENCLGKRSASGPEGPCNLAMTSLPGRGGEVVGECGQRGFLRCPHGPRGRPQAVHACPARVMECLSWLFIGRSD